MPTIEGSVEDARRAAEEMDWSAVAARTDEEIAEAVAADPDAAPVRSEEEIRARLRSGVAWLRQPPDVDVRALRQRFGLSQSAFAARFGFSKRTLQNWEQGRRRPEGSARLLLLLIERRPEAVLATLAEVSRAL